MKLELYKNAVITTDLPDPGLCKNDIVFLVDELGAPDGSRGYAVEVSNAFGEVLDVDFIAATALEPLRRDEVFCVRTLAVSNSRKSTINNFENCKPQRKIAL